MTLNLQTRAGSSVDDDLILELLDIERFEELKEYVGKNILNLPLINNCVFHYLSKLTNGSTEKRDRIVKFGEQEGYNWNHWRF